jgi:hypothetical protein
MLACCYVQYMSKAEAAATLAAKRAEVQARLLTLHRRRLAVAPEQALVPLKELEHLIASHYAVGGCVLGGVEGS